MESPSSKGRQRTGNKYTEPTGVGARRGWGGRAVPNGLPREGVTAEGTSEPQRVACPGFPAGQHWSSAWRLPGLTQTPRIGAREVTSDSNPSLKNWENGEQRGKGVPQGHRAHKGTPPNSSQCCGHKTTHCLSGCHTKGSRRT